MPRTVIALFKSPTQVEETVEEIEGLGFPRREVRTLEEPASLGVTGVMSFPDLDFKAEMTRALTQIGATAPEVQTFVHGIEKGGALVLATGSDRNVEKAAAVMNRRGAVQSEQSLGSEPELPEIPVDSMPPNSREEVSGARLFVW